MLTEIQVAAHRRRRLGPAFGRHDGMGPRSWCVRRSLPEYTLEEQELSPTAAAKVLGVPRQLVDRLLNTGRLCPPADLRV